MVRLSDGAVELRRARDELGLTQMAMAARVGIDVWYYAKIERGRRKPGRSVSVLIEEATSGRVPVAMWDRYDAKSRRAS